MFKSRDAGVTGFIPSITEDYVAMRRRKDNRPCEFIKIVEIGGIWIKRWAPDSEDCIQPTAT